MGKQRLELTWYNKDKALIPTEIGMYGYTWVDPSDPRYCETHTLVMDEYVAGVQSPKSDEFEYSERADLAPQTDNLMILGESGDVLEALTRVPELAEKYVGKVKLVYIDPPFNTQQAFASYDDALEHSVWLTMMRDRLLHLRKLLCEGGSIWVHLDDVENHRMRLLLDEVFGASSYVTDVCWQKVSSPSNNSHSIPMLTDSICVYSKGRFFPNRLPRTASADRNYSNEDNDPRGRWATDNPCARHNVGRRQHPGVYGIQHPITGEMLYPPANSNWRLEQARILEILQGWAPYEYGPVTEEELQRRAEIEGANVELRSDVLPLVVAGWSATTAEKARERYSAGNWPEFMITDGGTGGFRYKRYLRDVSGMVPGNLFFLRDVGSSDNAKKQIGKLFPGVVPFTTPKPEPLLERIIHIASDPGDIVIDVFGGSGTTAAVAQKMGRRWVTCELLPSTFETFTRPRLEKVVRNEDPTGVTFTKDRRLKEGAFLPEDFSTDHLQDATKLLNALAKIDELPEASFEAIREVKSLIATKPSNVLNWRGGGGFQVAHLSPTCFDVDEELGQVTLTEAATGDVLVESVAANLGFHLLHPDDDTVFEGRRGRTLLKVYEGVVDADSADAWLSELEDGESLLIAALGIADGVNKELRRFGKGCKAIVIPEDLFTFNAGEEE